MSGRQKKFYLKAINYLRKAFVYNTRAKGYISRDERDEYYKLKEEFYKKAIFLIKKYKLPIKRGVDKRNEILYFGTGDGQISFHYFGRKYKKKYNEKWKGYRNLSFPKELYNI